MEEQQTLIEQFIRLQGLVHKYFFFKRKDQGPFGNPHRGQGRVLNLLKLKPETTQKELSYLLDMRPQSLGELLGKLEKKGYITKDPLETDRRIMVIRLTEAGLIAANNSEQEEEATIFNELTQEEQESLHSIFEKLIESLEKELPEDGRGEFDPRHMKRGPGGSFGGRRRGGERMHPPFGREGHPFDSNKNQFREKFKFDFFGRNDVEDDGFDDF